MTDINDFPPDALDLRELMQLSRVIRAEIGHAADQITLAVAASTSRQVSGLPELRQLRSSVQRVRDLHRQEYGACRECTGESSVPWPCATVRALDAAGQQDAPSTGGDGR